MRLRILKEMHFSGWAKGAGISGAGLCKAADEVEAGLIDARSGGFPIKKRVAAPGPGKRRSYSTIIGYRQTGRFIFAYGFARNEKDNISEAKKPHQ